MNVKQWITGIVVGGLVVFGVGYVIFETLMVDFYMSNTGSATGAHRDPQILWAVLVAAGAYAALITYSLQSRPGALTAVGGAKVGAVVGFLLWLCADFTIYGITNVNNLTLTVVDPFVELVRGGITGAVLGLLLPKMA